MVIKLNLMALFKRSVEIRREWNERIGFPDEVESAATDGIDQSGGDLGASRFSWKIDDERTFTLL